MNTEPSTPARYLDYLGVINVHRGAVGDQSLHLGPVSVILAPNDHGKSTMLDLVRAVVTPAPSESYYATRHFLVRAEWSDGLIVERSADPDGKALLQINERPVAFKSGNATLAERLGRASTWKTDAFFAATAADRTEFLDVEVLGDGFVHETGSIGDAAYEGPATRADLDEIDRTMAPIEEGYASPTGVPLRVALRLVVKLLRERVSTLTADLRGAKAAAERAAKRAAAGVDHLPTLYAERLRLRTELAEGQTKAGRLQGIATAAARVAAGFAEIHAAIGNHNHADLQALVRDVQTVVMADLYVGGADVETMLVEALGAELDAVEERIRVAEVAEATGGAVTAEAAEAGAIAARLAAAEAALAALGTAYRKEVVRALGALATTTDRITRSAADFVLRFRAGEKAIEIECGDRDGAVVPIDKINRSRQAIGIAALRVAVVERLGGWRAVLMDRMEEIGAERRTAFVAAMVHEVTAGHLDTFLGACVDDGWQPDPTNHEGDVYAKVVRLAPPGVQNAAARAARRTP